MAKIRFKKWNVGMKPIAFVELLHFNAGIRLKEAKLIKDKIVNNDEIIDIEISDENLAKEIRDKSISLGVEAEIIND